MGLDIARAAQVRPFAHVLGEINRGAVADEAAAALAELVAAVRDTGRKGTVKLTITVAPFSGSEEVIQVTGTVDLKAPKPHQPASIFYADDTGSLSRNDPNALPMFTERDVPEGRAR